MTTTEKDKIHVVNQLAASDAGGALNSVQQGILLGQLNKRQVVVAGSTECTIFVEMVKKVKE